MLTSSNRTMLESTPARPKAPLSLYPLVLTDWPKLWVWTPSTQIYQIFWGIFWNFLSPWHGTTSLVSRLHLRAAYNLNRLKKVPGTAKLKTKDGGTPKKLGGGEGRYPFARPRPVILRLYLDRSTPIWRLQQRECGDFLWFSVFLRSLHISCAPGPPENLVG